MSPDDLAHRARLGRVSDALDARCVDYVKMLADEFVRRERITEWYRVREMAGNPATCRLALGQAPNVVAPIE